MRGSASAHDARAIIEVLPVPDCACAMTSRRAEEEEEEVVKLGVLRAEAAVALEVPEETKSTPRIAGRALAWIAEGFSKPWP